MHFTASYKLYKKKPFVHKIGSYSSWWNGLHKQLTHFEIVCLLCYLLASCVSPTPWPPQMAGSSGRRTWGPCCCPVPSSSCLQHFPNVHLKFHLLQVETFISHPQWVQGQVAPVPLPSWVRLSRPLLIFLFFLLCLGGSPLGPSIPCRVVLQAQDRSSA